MSDRNIPQAKRKRRQIKVRLIMKSAVFRLALMMFLIIVPICILTLVMSSRAIRMAENQVSEDLREALNLNMNQIDIYLQNLGRRLYTVSRENEDYAMLMSSQGGGDEEIERMHAYLRLGGVFSDILSEYTWADNVVAWFPDIDTFVSAKSSQMQKAQDVFLQELSDTEKSPGTRWLLSSEDRQSLIGIFDYRNTFYGASFRLSNLLDQIRLNTSSNIVAFARKGEKGLLSDRKELMELNVSDSRTNAEVDGDKYIILAADSQYSDLVLIDLVSRKELDRSLPGYIRILFILSIVFLVCIPLLFIAFGRWLVRPVNMLIDAIDYVDQGNLDYRIEKRAGTYEFDLLNSNFNEMMDSVKNLKINVYEKELEKRDIRLQYLSQQIQPHFILNAMNIIYSYEPEEYDLIQKMVLCLSRYFQFIVNANRPFVKVKHELEHISNYLTIQKIRYGDRICYRIESDEEAKETIMPPLMIQNLVENVIKYGLRDDRPVLVSVSAAFADGTVRITIRDTGYGMKDEILEKISRFQETGERQEGLGIGIQNTIERMELFFGKEARFQAERWNEDEGTQIILSFPALYENPEQKDPDAGE